MSRPSSIDRLPAEIRNTITRLRMDGRTIDEILRALEQMGSPRISRSALGRYLKVAEKVSNSLQATRRISEFLNERLGSGAEGEIARTNIQLMQQAIFDLFLKSADGLGVDKSGAAALAGNPDGMMKLARAQSDLTRASKSNDEFIARIEQRAAAKAKQEAATAVEKVAKEKGITAETLAAIKAGIFGVRAAGA